ncbi:MAG: Hsp20/alpha crystallin family protein [Planctomycetota bacterium]
MFGWRDYDSPDWFVNPRQEIARLQREMNRLFSGVGLESWRTSNAPAMNARLSDGDVVITVELPGADPESLDVSVIQDTLIIQGNRPEEMLEEGDIYHRRERDTGEFKRSLTLPYRVEADKVDARYEKGILTVALPRAASDRPKKIVVQKA